MGTISGQCSYVDLSQGGLVGADTVGSTVVGGGGAPNAYHFRNEFLLGSPKFEYVTFKFVATAVGALQINSYIVKDIRFKGRRTIPSYDTAN